MQLQDFKTLVLAPGEVLVIRPNRPISMEEAAKLKVLAEEATSHSGIKVLVVAHDFDVYGVRPVDET